MRRAHWTTSTDPDRMLEAAAGRLSDRQLLLFGCACARRVLGLLSDSIPAVISMVEGIAEVEDPGERHEALRGALLGSPVGQMMGLPVVLAQSRIRLAEYIPFVARVLRAWEWRAQTPPEEREPTEYLTPFLNTSPRRDHPEQAALLRCVAGDPFRPPRFDPAWRTSDVTLLATGIYADGAFDRHPILADALMDAGCGADPIQSHLRTPGPHARGCWVVDLVLGKS